MATMTAAHLLLSLILLTTTLLSYTEATISSNDYSWIPMTSKPTCQGSIAECMADGELEMDSEVHRRVLQSTTNYISYDALQANNVPCSQRGNSYYNNCPSPGQANPYTRSCTAVTQCRS